MNKKSARLRRARRTRENIKRLNANRVCVYRTSKHFYAQLIAPNGNILASASTLDGAIKTKMKYGGNIDAAKLVGRYFAERCANAGVKNVAFDRAGFKYHGRVKAFADAAREHGLDF